MKQKPSRSRDTGNRTTDLSWRTSPREIIGSQLWQNGYEDIVLATAYLSISSIDSQANRRSCGALIKS